MNPGISKSFRMSLKCYIIPALFILTQNLLANELRFSLHKITSNKAGPTLLVIGGIQGDEPGGFTAASMLVTNYNVRSGNVWVVPNLNFESIIKRSRGVHGDMNRKFKSLPANDPEFDEVQKIKQIILNKEVDVILNLHDGSGFYTKKYIDKLRNPKRWGQSIIIDQEKINSPKYGELLNIADKVQQHINKYIKNRNKFFYVKNTKTNKGNVEMEKTLTYYAISNNRPAFAVEASKQFLTYERTHYHLLAVEGFMNELGIEFSRNFKLTKYNVARQIGRNLKVSLYDNRVNLEVDKARHNLNYVPFNKYSPLEYKKNNPLIAVLANNKKLKIRYGNRYITSLNPQYFEFETSLNSIKMHVDGKDTRINIGEKVLVKENFRVLARNEYRVNIIGFSKHGTINENNILIERKQIRSRFSIDKDKNIFRVEFYKGKMFSGMILVSFKAVNKQVQNLLGISEKYSLSSRKKI